MTRKTELHAGGKEDFTIVFLDAGNCEIFETQIMDAFSFLEALTKAWEDFKGAGHNTLEVWQVQVHVIPF